MKSAVIINLDYANFEAGICRQIWARIDRGMAESGFSRNHRIFLADLDRETACARANDVVAAVDSELAFANISVFDAIREFYWFEYQPSCDQLALSNDLPEVSFVNMDDFRRFLSAGTN